jgi:adenylate kinase
MRIGITGSPRTGKTEAAKALSSLLKCNFYDLNSLCIERNLGKSQGDEFVVNIRKARNAISAFLRHQERFVISGLLLPDIVPSRMLDQVAVLRCNPKILYERYKKAGYSEEKAKDNVVAEAIGSVYSESVKAFGSKVFQVDVSNMNVNDVVDAILKRKNSEVDWLKDAEKDKELLRLLL